jgi:hypothetical protein
MGQLPVGDDDPLVAPRRYVRRNGYALVRRVDEFAESGDEGAFRELLHELEIYEGDPKFEGALAAFHARMRERGL